jgi:hypothetical protein
MKKIIITISFIFLVQLLFAQDFKFESKLNNISETGFHKIHLKAEIAAKLEPAYSDIRIFDDQGTEVPYLLNTEEPLNRSKFFKEYEVIEKIHNEKHAYTRLIIHNPDKNEITNFSLLIRNSDVKKWLKLNAGDDMKQWYVLKDRYYFQSVYNNSETSEIKILNFPLSNYEYYELLISDFFDNPINVLKVGYHDYSIELGQYSELPVPKISQNDTILEKQTTVKISFPEVQYIDKITFKIEGGEFFYREARLRMKGQKLNRKKVMEEYELVVKNFKLISSSSNTLHLSRLQAKELYLDIWNYDDKPLKITAVNAYQLNTYLTASLKKDVQYFLKFGDETLKSPVYDLEYFADSIPANLHSVSCGDIKSLIKEEVEKPLLSLESVWLWIIIGAVIMLLGFMSFKMIKEIGNTKKQA